MPVMGRSSVERAREAIADALRAIDAGLPGEAWAALEAAQERLIEADSPDRRLTRVR